MRQTSVVLAAAAAIFGNRDDAVLTTGYADGEASSPIFGVTVPEGYRRWELVRVAHEAGLDELRGIVGNTTAMEAYRAGTLPFPDGSILVKLAWKHVNSTEFEPAFVPGARHDGPDHGQRFEAIFRNRRVGIWPLHRWPAGRRGSTQDLLRLPRGRGQGSRLRLHAIGALTPRAQPPARRQITDR